MVGKEADQLSDKTDIIRLGFMCDENNDKYKYKLSYLDVIVFQIGIVLTLIGLQFSLVDLSRENSQKTQFILNNCLLGRDSIV